MFLASLRCFCSLEIVIFVLDTIIEICATCRVASFVVYCYILSRMFEFTPTNSQSKQPVLDLYILNGTRQADKLGEWKSCTVWRCWWWCWRHLLSRVTPICIISTRWNFSAKLSIDPRYYFVWGPQNRKVREGKADVTSECVIASVGSANFFVLQGGECC